MSEPLPARILYIEDDQVDQMVFARLIKKSGQPFEYKIAGSVGEARDFISHHSFDLIITDFCLGDGTAKDVVKWATGIPTILASGSDDNEIINRANDIGANDYLTKPFDFEHLSNIIRKILNNHSVMAPTLINTKVESAAHFNLNYLFEIAGGDKDFVREIITLFITNTPQTLQEIQSYHSIKDYKAVKDAAHKYKSSIKILGHAELGEIAATIEKYALDPEKTTQVCDLLEKFDQRCREFADNLSHELLKLDK